MPAIKAPKLRPISLSNPNVLTHCANCGGVLTGTQQQFCSPACGIAHLNTVSGIALFRRTAARFER